MNVPLSAVSVRRLAAVSLAGLVGLGLLSGCGGSDSKSDKPEVKTSTTGTPGAASTTGAPAAGSAAKLGSPVEVTVGSTKLKVTVSDVKPENPATEEPFKTRGKKYATAKVEIEHVGGPALEVEANTLFRLVTKDARQFKADLLGGLAFAGALEDGTLEPGKKLAGLLVFGAEPAQVTGARLQILDKENAVGTWAV
ncbi:DUF4352 domain-containing protein [Longispora sp. NPDC051575]|uniref:DUF4352 domain-containing protein n=1 Tax=Longispora sp. NPDC051575 TaxID=3154943 RepID=UPI003428EA24